MFRPRLSKFAIPWLLFLALDALFVAAVGEIWVRLFVPVESACWRFDPELGPRLCPNQERISHVEKGYRNTLITNSIGTHDLERQEEKPPDVYRIHVYGDSVIVGAGVPIAETIPAAVERRLRSMGLGYRVEVSNMGWLDSTTSQILFYRAVGRRYRPDMVVSSFMDDLPDNLAEVHRRRHQSHYRLDDDGELVFVPLIPKGTDTLWENFKRSSRLYRLMANKLFASKVYYDATKLWKLRGIRKSATQSGLAKTRQDDGLTARQRLLIEKGWPLTLKLFGHFRDGVEADGARFVLADGRTLYDVNAGTVYDNRDIERFCAGEGIDYVSSYEVLDRLVAADPAEGYFLEDRHPTARGNEILGVALADQLAKLLPEEWPRRREAHDG